MDNDKFQFSQFNHDDDLTLQARRKRRRNFGENELILPEFVTPSTMTPFTASNSYINNNGYEFDKNLDMDYENSLVHKPHSEFAKTVSSIAAFTKIGLDIASMVSNVYLETAKYSTKAGIDITRSFTGTLSDKMVKATSLEGCGGRIIGASTNLLNRTLNLAEQIALASLEFTSGTIQLTLGTATESMTLIDALFGTTDAAKALAEFVQLVKREWRFDDEVRADDPFGLTLVIKSLTAWACIQYVTRDKWEKELGSWKRVKLVEFSDLCNDWVHIEPDDTLMENLESFISEEEDDEEVIFINNNNNNSKKNIMVGELTPREEKSEYISKMDEDKAKRFSDLSNPYLEEIQSQSEDERLFTLLHNLKRYSKFSSCAYDIKATIKSSLPLPTPRWRQQKGSLHRLTFASSTDLSSDSIVDSSHQKVTNGRSYQPTYFLIRDHTAKSIILALRGTMSVHDLIVDLTCEYQDFQLPEDIQRGDDTIHQVHKGMFKVAKSMSTPGQSGVFEALKREMEANEGYGLILVGHSLGAGIASLLALLFASPTTRMTTRWSRLPLGRRVHAYAFATPCVMSAELSKRAKTLVTSVAYGDDVICRLSIGHILDLRNIIRSFGGVRSETGSNNEDDISNKIIKKVIDYQSRRFSNDSEGQALKAEYESWFLNIRQDITNSQMNNLKLYPPGRVYWVVKSNKAPYCEVNDDTYEEENTSTNYGGSTNPTDKSNKPYIMLEIEDVDKIFREIWFSSRMMMDHLPHVYENILKNL